MQLTYYLDDGYAGSQSRPHHVKIDDDELEEMNEKEKEEYIDEVVQQHFSENISCYWDRKQLKK
jgi:hypothetical protein